MADEETYELHGLTLLDIGPPGTILTSNGPVKMQVKYDYDFIFKNIPRMKLYIEEGGAYPYVMGVNYLAFTTYAQFEAERREMDHWCTDHFEAGAFVSTRDEVRFASQDDAFAFKMRWG